MPEREIALRHKMQGINQFRTHYFWTDKDVAQLEMPPKMQALYDLHYKEKKWAFAADVLRLWVVFIYGGFYVDVDFDFTKSLDDLRSCSAFVCYHPTQPNDHTVVNGIFGACKRHPMMGALVDATQDNAWWVGPEMVGRTIKKWLNLPYEIEHDVFKDRMEKDHNIHCMDWQAFDREYAKHLALYSWK